MDAEFEVDVEVVIEDEAVVETLLLVSDEAAADAAAEVDAEALVLGSVVVAAEEEGTAEDAVGDSVAAVGAGTEDELEDALEAHSAAEEHDFEVEVEVELLLAEVRGSVVEVLPASRTHGCQAIVAAVESCPSDHTIPYLTDPLVAI